MKRAPILAVLTVGLIAGAAGGIAYADDTDNDRILRGDKGEYLEFFKKDSKDGRKNYLYTVTGFVDQFGRECTVVTGDSEKTITVDCDQVQR